MINRRQYIILSFFMTRCVFIGGGFSLLVRYSKNNVLITGILGMLLGLVLLYFFSKRKKINDFLLVVTAFLLLIFTLIINSMLTNTFLLVNTPTLFILLLVMALLIYGSFKGIKMIARVSEIVIVGALIIFLLCHIGLTPYSKFSNIFPLFNSSYGDFFKSLFIFLGAALTPNILLLNYKEDLKFKDLSIGYIAGCISIIILLYFILSIYGSEFSMRVRFPEYLILKRINILGYINNVENILVMEWLTNIMVSSMVCLAVIKERVNKYVFWALVIALLFIIEGVFNHNYDLVLIIKNNLYYVYCGLIFLCFIVKKKNE